MFNWYWILPVGVAILFVQNIVNSIFLHRIVCHRSAEFTSPALFNFCRLWLWVFGFSEPNLIKWWVAVHRKHHEMSDSTEDPHSPYFFNFREITFGTGRTVGSVYHMPWTEVEQYSKDIPYFTDWIELNVYQKFRYPFIILIFLFFILFGVWGMLVSIPILLYSKYVFLVLGGLTHTRGYRNRPAAGTDRSVNLCPVGILFVGEELAANHHDNQASPKFSEKWWEFDLGWGVMLVLQFFGLIKIRYK